MADRNVLIVGGGIAGLAAALACGRAGAAVQVLERAGEFGEVGAGVQIGPNVTRRLQAWGLDGALAAVAAFPGQLQVRDIQSGRELGVLRLGQSAQQRYGAPYATLHRADLHRLLLTAVQAQGATALVPGQAVTRLEASATQVTAHLAGGGLRQGDVLLGADGLWSQVREHLLHDGPARPTGHLAYRALVRQSDLPQAMRSQQVTVWLGPDQHVVQYPVRRGEWLNVVAIVQGRGDWLCAANATPGQLANWNQQADAAGLRNALAGACRALRDLVHAVDAWRLWILCDRAPMQGPQEHAAGRIALVGDAAHPMRPYLAQGAGMAIEDAAAVGALLADTARPVESALRDFALQRWRRNRQVQIRSRRNGRIFHSSGLVRLGRDAALRILGERLLDLPWLYRG